MYLNTFAFQGRDDIHLNFDDDSDRDEAEASEDDMEDELEASW